MKQLIRVRVKGGYLVASVSPNADYPGIDVEYVPDKPNENKSNARIRMEANDFSEEIKAFIWNDSDKEDFSDVIFFKEKGTKLADSLRVRSDDQKRKENEVINEIKHEFLKYISSGGLDSYIKTVAKQSKKTDRKLVLTVAYSNYHGGFSETSFYAAGFCWKNPEQDAKSFASYIYKGVLLKGIQERVIAVLTDILEKQLKNDNFSIKGEKKGKDFLGNMQEFISISW